MPHSRRGKIRPFQLGDILVIGMLSTRASDCKKTTFFKKVLIPPVNSPEPLYIKASLVFHPSLGPSRHLSHIPPVIPHSPHVLRQTPYGPDGRDDGRDMGGIENIPPVLKPLYTKAFQKMMGEMRDF